MAATILSAMSSLAAGLVGKGGVSTYREETSSLHKTGQNKSIHYDMNSVLHLLLEQSDPVLPCLQTHFPRSSHSPPSSSHDSRHSVAVSEPSVILLCTVTTPSLVCELAIANP